MTDSNGFKRVAPGWLPCALALAIASGWTSAAAADDGAGAREALGQVRAALGSGVAAAHGRHADLSGALRVLALRGGTLSTAERREAKSFLLRPSGPAGGVSPSQRYPGGVDAKASPACADEICLHWTDRGQHAPPAADLNGVADGDGIPDYVEQTLAALRHSARIENGTLRWRRARADGKLGEPDSKPKANRADAYLLDLGRSIAGFTAVDPGGKGRRRSGWVAIDNDFAELGAGYLPLLQVTVAHEYNHLLQYAYDVGQETWLYESVATYIEDVVFPNANLYLGFVRRFARLPRVPLDSAATMYGAATLHQFIVHAAGAKLIRQVWDGARRFSGSGRSYRALDAGLKRGGVRAESMFARFAVSSAVWQDRADFPDRRMLPRVKRSREVRRGGPDTRVRLGRMSYAIVPVKAIGRPAKLRLRVKGPAKVHGFVGLAVERKGTARVDRLSKLKRGGRTITLKRPSGVAKVEVVVIDTDFRRGRGADRRFRGDRRRFTVKAR